MIYYCKVIVDYSTYLKKFESYIFPTIFILGFILRFIGSLDPIEMNDSNNYIEIAYQILYTHTFDQSKQVTYGNRLVMVLYVVVGYGLFGTHQIWLQIYYMIPSLLSLIVVKKFTFDLTNNQQISYLSSLFLALFPLEIYYSGSGTLDSIYGFFTGLFFWLYYRSTRQRWSNHKRIYAMFAGMNLYVLYSLRGFSLAFFIVIISYWIISDRKNLKKRLNAHLILLISFLFLFSIEMIYYTLTVGFPFFSFVKRVGFQSIFELIGFTIPTNPKSGSPIPIERLQEIGDLNRYPSYIFGPSLFLASFGIMVVLSIVYTIFVKFDKEDNAEISYWIMFVFSLLQWFPVRLFSRSLSYLRENNIPLGVEKQVRFLLNFSITGTVLSFSTISRFRKINVKGFIILMLILSNLLFNFYIIQPTNPDYGRTNVRKVTDFMRENNISEFYIDDRINRDSYLTASNFEFTIRIVDPINVSSLSQTYYVVNSSFNALTTLEGENPLNNHEVVASFYLNSMSASEYSSYEFTTVVYKID